MRTILPLTLILATLSVALAAEAPTLVFRESGDAAPVLAFWTGEKPTQSEVAVAKTEPDPAEGDGYIKLTAQWPEEGPGYSYWNVTSFQPIELRKGVKYTFRGKVFCPAGSVQPKVMFDLPGSKVQPIWHGSSTVKGDGWLEFIIPDLRAIAEALSVKEKWDTDTVMLRTIFFNLSDKPAVFAVDDLQILAQGTALPQYVREHKADYVVSADFPLLRIQAAGDCSGLKAFLRTADDQEELLLDGTLYGEDASADGEHTLYARLTSIPQQVWLRLPAEATCKIASVAIVMPGGKVHAAIPGALTAPDIAYTFDPKALGPIPERKLPPIRVGVYYAPYTINDLGHLPSSAWLYTPRPETFAPLDFSVIQTQTVGSMVPTREFCTKLRQLNPKHRIILRLAPITGAIPKYFFEPFYRRGLIEYYTELINNAGAENVYAVTIGEEENGNFTSGLWWRDTPPDWIEAYRVPFERETGKKLTWVNAVCGNRDFLEWLRPKIRFFYNDVYTQLKSRFPDLKVLQYLSIAASGSGISWHEPGEIMADGWVYWNFRSQHELMLVDCQLATGQTVPVSMLLDGTFRHLLRIRNSGLPNEEIYHCGFAHHEPGKFYNIVDQIKMLRDLGFRNSFAFYGTGAFLRPADCKDPAKVGEIDQEPYKTRRDRLERALAYQKEMAAP